MNETDLETNFSDWTTYTYTKISPKKAHLNFMAPQISGAVLRTFQYDFDMTFTSSTEFLVSGLLKVNYLSGPNAYKTYVYDFTGNGRFVDNLQDNSPSTGNQDTPKFSFTKPQITNITETSATVSGIVSGSGTYGTGVIWEIDKTKLDNANLYPNDCSHIEYAEGNIINKTIKVYPGYTYKVRLFARNEYTWNYSESVELVVPGEIVQNFTTKQTYWNVHALEFDCFKPAYIVGDYGLCWGENPNPTIADNFIKEVKDEANTTSVKHWTIKDLKRATKYYVRPYHINGLDVTYFDESVVETLGADTNVSLDVSWSKYEPEESTIAYMGELIYVWLNLKWHGFPQESLKVQIWWSSGLDSYYGNYDKEFYTEPTGEGDKYFFCGKYCALCLCQWTRIRWEFFYCQFLRFRRQFNITILF